MADDFKRNTIQYQMSDELALFIIKFIKRNNITFDEFCKGLGMPKYFVRKIVDRKIQMHVYGETLLKIRKYVGAEDLPAIKPLLYQIN